MAISSSVARELVNIASAMVHFKQYSMLPMVHPKWTNVTTSEKAYEESFRAAGVGTFVLKREGTPVAYDEPVIGNRKRELHATYALGYRIPMELMEDDQFGIIAQMPGDLGDSGRDHQERLAHAPINDAFAGATFTGMPEGDGTRRSLCNTGHVPMRGLGTQSNRISPGAALSTTSLREAITILELTQSEEGRQTPLQPAILLIHPNERWNAEQLLESTQEPFTSENQINPTTRARLGIAIVRSPYLTDTDAFFVMARKGQHSVKMVRRKGLTMDTGRDMDNFDSKHTAHYRAVAHFADWRGVVGSAPGT